MTQDAASRAALEVAESALRESARAVTRLVMDHPTVKRHASNLDRELLEQQVFNSMKAALSMIPSTVSIVP